MVTGDTMWGQFGHLIIALLSGNLHLRLQEPENLLGGRVPTIFLYLWSGTHIAQPLRGWIMTHMRKECAEQIWSSLGKGFDTETTESKIVTLNLTVVCLPTEWGWISNPLNHYTNQINRSNQAWEARITKRQCVSKKHLGIVTTHTKTVVFFFFLSLKWHVCLSVCCLCLWMNHEIQRMLLLKSIFFL